MQPEHQLTNPSTRRWERRLRVLHVWPTQDTPGLLCMLAAGPEPDLRAGHVRLGIMELTDLLRATLEGHGPSHEESLPTLLDDPPAALGTLLLDVASGALRECPSGATPPSRVWSTLEDLIRTCPEILPDLGGVLGTLAPTSLPIEAVIEDLRRYPVGTMWPWYGLHPEDPLDLLALEGRQFKVTELYCPLVTCPCRVMHLRVQEGEPPAEMGCLHVDLDSGTLMNVTGPRKARAVLKALWHQLRDRHPRFPDRARARSNEIRLMGRLVYGEVSNRLDEDTLEYLRSLEPNDPCFCGSGRKFKRCCQPIVTRLTGSGTPSA